MKKHAITAGVLATLAIGLAAPALASTDDVLPTPVGPQPVNPQVQTQNADSVSWFAPFGANVKVVYGVTTP